MGESQALEHKALEASFLRLHTHYNHSNKPTNQPTNNHLSLSFIDVFRFQHRPSFVVWKAPDFFAPPSPPCCDVAAERSLSSGTRRSTTSSTRLGNPSGVGVRSPTMAAANTKVTRAQTLRSGWALVPPGSPEPLQRMRAYDLQRLEKVRPRWRHRNCFWWLFGFCMLDFEHLTLQVFEGWEMPGLQDSMGDLSEGPGVLRQNLLFNPTLRIWALKYTCIGGSGPQKVRPGFLGLLTFRNGRPRPRAASPVRRSEVRKRRGRSRGEVPPGPSLCEHLGSVWEWMAHMARCFSSHGLMTSDFPNSP